MLLRYSLFSIVSSHFLVPFFVRFTLTSNSVNIWIDKIGLKPGTPDWEETLREAIKRADGIVLVASSDSRRSPYVRDELAIARMHKKSVYPVWASGEEWIDSIPMGMGYVQFIDMRDGRYTTGVMELVRAIGGEVTFEPLPDPVDELYQDIPLDFEPRNPYKGLRAFRAKDRSDFFGRTDLIKKLVERLNSERFVAVVGPSGSGKSSVIMGGLLPALNDGALPGSDSWVYLDPMVPGTHPLENLTLALVKHMPEKSQKAIREDLDDRSTRGLHLLARQIAEDDQRVVLYIDQFEELFTITAQESERQHMIDLITTAVTEPDNVVTVVISLRADFYDRPLNYADIGRLMKEHTEPILPMSLADLYDIVQRPANQSDVRLAFEEGLVTELVFAVKEELSALPLLQFTLDQLFEHRDSLQLTWQAYDEIGGLRGALAQHAEATYSKLPSDKHREMARVLFLRLIEPGVTEQDTTRRRATEEDLTLPNQQDTQLLREVAEMFTAKRLLVSDENMLEVSHEALIREWSRLRGWLSDGREDIQLQNQIAQDAAEWVRRGKQVDDVYRGSRLTEAQYWVRRNEPSMLELEFIEAGAEERFLQKEDDEQRIAQLRQAFEDAQMAQTQAEKASERASLNRRNMGISILVAILVGLIAIFLTFNANDAQQQAELRASDANTQQANANNRIATATIELAMANMQIATSIVLRDEASAEITALEAIIPAATLAQGLIPIATQVSIYHEWITGLSLEEKLQFVDEYNPENGGNGWIPIEHDFNGVTMVLVPAGCFNIGNDLAAYNGAIDGGIQCFDEPFWIGKYEVTNAEFAEFIAAGGYDNPDYWTEIGWETQQSNEWTQPEYWMESRFNGDEQPIIGMSWYEAAAYAAWRGMRLPTEAEWEYAARGMNNLFYPWGNEFVADNIVYNGNSDSQTAPVGSRYGGASWVGAYDLGGNAWEWTLSQYIDYPYVADDEREALEGYALRVLRGGSWRYDLDYARAAFRFIANPDHRGLDFGFRLVYVQP